MSRTILTYFGILLVLVGLMGLLLGDRLLFGFLNIDIEEDIIHLITGFVMLYAGTQKRLVKPVGYIVGTFYLLAFIIGLVSPNFFGLLDHGYSMVDNLIHLTIGGVLLYDARKRSKTLVRIFTLP